MQTEYVITATVPVPDDFDGQAEVASNLRTHVGALRERAPVQIKPDQPPLDLDQPAANEAPI